MKKTNQEDLEPTQQLENTPIVLHAAQQLTLGSQGVSVESRGIETQMLKKVFGCSAMNMTASNGETQLGNAPDNDSIQSFSQEVIGKNLAQRALSRASDLQDDSEQICCVCEHDVSELGTYTIFFVVKRLAGRWRRHILLGL